MRPDIKVCRFIYPDLRKQMSNYQILPTLTI